MQHAKWVLGIKSLNNFWYL